MSTISDRISIRSLSYLLTVIIAGVFCSAFVTQITDEEGNLKFQDFYKVSSFYFLIVLFTLEIIKNILLHLIDERDRKISQLKQKIDELIREKEDILRNQREERARVTLPASIPFENMSPEEKAIIYALCKVIASTSERNPETFLEDECRQEFNPLQEILQVIFQNRNRR